MLTRRPAALSAGPAPTTSLSPIVPLHTKHGAQRLTGSGGGRPRKQTMRRSAAPGALTLQAQKGPADRPGGANANTDVKKGASIMVANDDSPDGLISALAALPQILVALIIDLLLIVPLAIVRAIRARQAQLEELGLVRVESTAMVDAMPDDTPHTNVVDWVRAFRKRHGRDPKIAELQGSFPEVPKTTAWRRIKAA